MEGTDANLERRPFKPHTALLPEDDRVNDRAAFTRMGIPKNQKLTNSFFQERLAGSRSRPGYYRSRFWVGGDKPVVTSIGPVRS
jgi:hypothetical protein